MKMKRILYILLLAMGMTMIAPLASIVDNSVAVVYSADDKAKTKQQRDREKAKAQQQREREKAKAQQQREREQRAKEQAKASRRAIPPCPRARSGAAPWGVRSIPCGSAAAGRVHSITQRITQTNGSRRRFC